MAEGGITGAMLAAMIDAGAFDDAAGDQLKNTDWLSNPPDHICAADFGRSTPMPLESGMAHQAPQVCTPEKLGSRLLTVDQMLAPPPTNYVVADLLPERGLAAIYGAPGAAKSFLAIDLAFAIESGRPRWFGRRVMQAPVAYIALEGKGGMRKRIAACVAHTGEDVSAQIRFFTGNLSLLNRSDAQALAEEINGELGAGTVTIIDTLSRALAGGDENSSVDMTAIVENAELLGQIVLGPVVLIHHTGKDHGKGLRGHSSLLGAVDASIEVTCSSGARSWSLKKNKDGEDGGVYSFELVSYRVGEDQWGDEVRSCGIRPLVGAPVPALRPVTGKIRIPVMAAIREALTQEPAGIGWDHALGLAVAQLGPPNGRRNTVAKATLKGLVASGHLCLTNGTMRLP